MYGLNYFVGIYLIELFEQKKINAIPNLFDTNMQCEILRRFDGNMKCN